MDKNELDALLRSIKGKYIERLGEDEIRLERLCARLNQEHAALDELVEEIRSVAHKLAGISGSLGFSGVQEAASTLDKSADRTQGAAQPMEAILECSQALLREIKTAREHPDHQATSRQER